MTTVKEFKDLGVVFVDGDEGETFHVHDAEGFNRPNSCFNGDKVTRFVWRPLDTLPDRPKFLFDIDYENHSWRPSLDQSDSKVGEPTKPVFTQAMADVGELPPVGCECLLCLTFVTYKAKITYLGNGVGCFIDLADNKELTFSILNASFKPIDTRTPKQKAVDEAEKVITNKVPTVSVALAKAVIGALYDAELLKK